MKYIQPMWQLLAIGQVGKDTYPGQNPAEANASTGPTINKEHTKGRLDLLLSNTIIFQLERKVYCYKKLRTYQNVNNLVRKSEKLTPFQ
jgi:hypothetical protein